MICAVLLGDTIEELYRQAHHAEKLNVDLIEMRLDSLNTVEFSKLQKIILKIHKDIILSYRSAWYNEELNPPLEGRTDFLKNLFRLKCKYIDLEYPIDMKLLNEMPKNIIPIISNQDFQGMAKITYDGLIDIAKKYPNAIIKISATPNTVSDIQQMWKWSEKLTKEKVKHILIGMGSKGSITRIKSLDLHNEWTYGRINKKIGEPMQPGMLDVNQLKNAFSDNSFHFGVISNNYDSIINKVFNNFLRNSSIKGVSIDIPLSNYPELGQFLLWVEDGLFNGIYVKEIWQNDIMKKIEQKDASVYQSKFCNTITVENNSLKLYNTYIRGIIDMLREFNLKKIKSVYIEGSEILLTSMISALKDNVETIVVRERDEYKLIEIQNDFPIVISSSDTYEDDFDLTINSQIPIKGYENVLTLPKKIVENTNFIFDPVATGQNPTPLIKYAIANNKQNLNGQDLLLHTLRATYELWTKKSISSSSFKKIKINKKYNFNENF